VAGCAHFFFAGYLVMLTAMLWPSEILTVTLGITGFAAVKEFVYDAKYELNPPQTFLDNLEDFVTYVLGAWGTYLIVQ
jgi:hypothetical protein